jgi:hypothetical protein
LFVAAIAAARRKRIGAGVVAMNSRSGDSLRIFWKLPSRLDGPGKVSCEAEFVVRSAVLLWLIS